MSEAPCFYPGSDEAVLEGCTCDPIVNRQGKGVLGLYKAKENEIHFWIARTCPLHGQMSEEYTHVQAE